MSSIQRLEDGTSTNTLTYTGYQERWCIFCTMDKNQMSFQFYTVTLGNRYRPEHQDAFWYGIYRIPEYLEKATGWVFNTVKTIYLRFFNKLSYLKLLI